MENWKNKFKKKKQKFTNNNEVLEDALPVSREDLIGDEWKKADEDFTYESTDNDSGSPRFADDEDDSRNFITLDELSNPDEHVKVRERLVKLEELRETEPHQSKNMKIDGNRIEAKCQEFRKPLYLSNIGYIFLILIFLAIRIKDVNINNIWIGSCIILCLLSFIFVLLIRSSNPTISVWLDKNKNACFSCSGLFTNFGPKQISEYDLYYHLHKSRYYRISFLHLDLKFEDGCYFSISGKTFESLRNDRASCGAENLQALGGEYAIQQIAKLLGKARNCKRV